MLLCTFLELVERSRLAIAKQHDRYESLVGELEVGGGDQDEANESESVLRRRQQVELTASVGAGPRR